MPKAQEKIQGGRSEEFIFSAYHPRVKDDQDHYPIRDEDQARSALARAAQQGKAPSWYAGTIRDLRKEISAAVKKYFPEIKPDLKTWTEYAHISTWNELREEMDRLVQEWAKKEAKKGEEPYWYVVDILLEERAIIVHKDTGEYSEITYDLDMEGGIILLEEIPVRQQWVAEYAEEIETVDIDGVELFAGGTTESEEYTEARIKKLAAAAAELAAELKPPVYCGHTREHGWPAFGWVENIRAVGAKLVGDFKKVPKTIAAWIKSGGFRRVSAEIMPDYEAENGKTYKEVFWGVALLGQDIPRIRILKDLPIPVYGDARYPEVYTFDRDELKITNKGGEGKMTQEAKDKIALEAGRYAELLDKEKAADAAADQTEQIKAYKAEIETLKARVAELEKDAQAKAKEFADAREAARKEKIAGRVEALKASGRITPAEEPRIRTFAETLSDTVAVKYAVAGEEKEGSQLEAYLSGLEARPENSAVNFSVESRNDKGAADRGKDEDEVLVGKARAYMDEHKGVSFGEALRAVNKESK